MFSSISIVSMLKFGLKLKSLKEGFESALAMSFHCLVPHKKPEDKGQFAAVRWLPMLASMDYGQPKAKSPILCGPNSNANPK